ncbi:hypothetical protein HDU87_003216 [Geranomyces variabilis]|uniref:Uncharacterized protein n=1 Tax=Geranomyces variabilis TaxID=109894 RepID=A0AAD5TKS0_9FUNG|nr:hypothetical protein HDU87_003216 [Geranomyces variabilis]
MRHIGPRPLFVALLPLLLVALLLNTLSQALPRLFTASPTYLATPQQPSPPPDAATYLATHPPTRIGFWKECTGSAPCTDLQLACGADAQPDTTALQNTPLEGLAAQFGHKQAQLCPRVNAARVLMALSLFAGAVAVFAVALRLAGVSSNGAAVVPGLFAVSAAGLMCVMHLAAVGLLASVKNILDSLAELTRSLHPATGTSTTLSTVTTEYALSASFWLVIAAAAVSCALLPLAIVLAVHPASRRASLLPYPPLSGANNPPRAAKATSTTTLPLASLTTPPRRSATHQHHQLRHADSGTGLIDDANHDRYYNYDDNESAEPLYRRSGGGGGTAANPTTTNRPRHHSASTTASPPMTVIGAPYDDARSISSSSSSEDDEYGIPSPPPMMARPAGGVAGVRISTGSGGDHPPATTNTPLSWRR